MRDMMREAHVGKSNGAPHIAKMPHCRTGSHACGVMSCIPRCIDASSSIECNNKSSCNAYCAIRLGMFKGWDMTWLYLLSNREV